MASRITLKFLPNGMLLPTSFTNFGFNHRLSNPVKIVSNNQIKPIQKLPKKRWPTHFQAVQQQYFETENSKEKSCFYCGHLNTIIERAKYQ